MHRSCASRIRARRGRRRRMRFVTTDYATYEANELNQYTRINTNGTDFTPEYDAPGNQTRLQIATLDLLAEGQPLKHTILWTPTQPTATRPLAIQQSGTWYTYKTPGGCKGGWTCAKHAPGGREAVGRLRVKTPDGCKGGWTCAKHAPGGREAVGRLRVNYRYYNPRDGRWTRRDPIGIEGRINVYNYTNNQPTYTTDYIGEETSPFTDEQYAQCIDITVKTRVRRYVLGYATIDWLPGPQNAIHKTERFYQYPSMLIKLTWKTSSMCQCAQKAFDKTEKSVWFTLKHFYADGSGSNHIMVQNLVYYTLYGKPNQEELGMAQPIGWNGIGVGFVALGLGTRSKYVQLAIYVESYDYLDNAYYF